MDNLTIKQFKDAVHHVIESGFNQRAQLGSCGAPVILQGSWNPNISRISQVSVRLHNSTVELLCTNKQGEFVYHGKYHKNLGVDFIAEQHFQIYNLVKDFLGLDKVEPYGVLMFNNITVTAAKQECYKGHGECDCPDLCRENC